MQAAGNLISAASEFTARVKNGKYDFHCRNTGLVVNPGRNAPPIIDHSHRVSPVNRDADVMTVTCQGLIHRVIHNFIDQMMKTLGRSGADIHTGSLSNCLKPFQNLDLICSVFLLCHFFLHSILNLLSKKGLSIENLVDPVDREFIFHKLIQAGTADDSLYIIDRLQKIILPI